MQLLLILSGCAGTADGLQLVKHPSFDMHQVGPDGTVFEKIDHPTRALQFVDNDPDEAIYIGNAELEHGEAPVTGAGCVTATTIHVPYGFSLTFGPDGAILDPEHMLMFTVSDDDVRRADRRYLFGGRINVLEHDADTISIQLVDGQQCPMEQRQCDPEDLAPQAGPYELTIEGTFVVPLGTSEVRSTTSLYTDPTSGQPLCEAFQPAIDGGYRE